MSNIEKLISIRNTIINNIINKEKINKTREHFILKGSFFKNILKYAFLKPFITKEIKTPEESFFSFENTNIPKLFNIFVILLISICQMTNNNPSDVFVFYLILFFGVFGTILISKLDWNFRNKKTDEKFNQKNIRKIKKNLFEDFNEEEVNFLLDGSLSKKELSMILKELNSVISENELIDMFYKLKTKKSNDITNPHNLIFIINKIIDDEKKEENEKSFENEFKKTNKKIIKSLEEVKTYS